MAPAGRLHHEPHLHPEPGEHVDQRLDAEEMQATPQEIADARLAHLQQLRERRLLEASRRHDLLVLAFAVDREQRFPWSRFVQHTTSAGDGTYALGGVPGGSYYVTAVDAWPVAGDDAWQDASVQESLVPTASMVTVNDGEVRTLALRSRTP